jgi:DNA segregation ATPase FtsK/SpoIIIE-like protein
MPVTASVDSDKPVTAAKPAVARPRRKRRGDPRRWIREARGIVAVTVAGFALVSLAVFDPALPPAEQDSPVGPVGWWLGWALFRALGYAGFLLPLLLAAWGAAAFMRPRMTRGWVPLIGFAVLLGAAAGLLQQAADTFVAERVTRGGVLATGGSVGWMLSSTLHTTLGRVGAWLLLLAAVPIGVLLVTQASYAAVVRLGVARLKRLRRVRRTVPPPAPRVELDTTLPPLLALPGVALVVLGVGLVVRASRPAGLAEPGT